MSAVNEPASFACPVSAEEAPHAVAEMLGGRQLALQWGIAYVREARRRVESSDSVGIVLGAAREGSPEGFYALICITCGATWTGEEGERCPWCERRLDAANERAERSRS